MNSIALIIIINVIIPVSLETGNCFLPHPGNEGYLCHWEQKDFIIKNGEQWLVVSNDRNFVWRAN